MHCIISASGVCMHKWWHWYQILIWKDFYTPCFKLKLSLKPQAKSISGHQSKVEFNLRKKFRQHFLLSVWNPRASAVVYYARWAVWSYFFWCLLCFETSISVIRDHAAFCSKAQEMFCGVRKCTWLSITIGGEKIMAEFSFLGISVNLISPWIITFSFKIESCTASQCVSCARKHLADQNSVQGLSSHMSQSCVHSTDKDNIRYRRGSTDGLLHITTWTS